MKPPEELDRVFHYANARPTEKTWRRIVLGPPAHLILAPGADPPELPTFGVKSLEEIERLLAEFRAFLSRWVELESAYSEDAGELLREINNRAQLQFRGWALSRSTEHLTEVWETQESSFPELLYSHLAGALKEVSFRAIHKCESCGNFFYEPSKRQWKFCSPRCRNRVMVQRHRERQASGANKARGAPAGRRTSKRK